MKTGPVIYITKIFIKGRSWREVAECDLGKVINFDQIQKIEMQSTLPVCCWR